MRFYESQTQVQKCHVIFYVVRSDVETEAPILRKVQGYLRDNAKIYSIMNLRGNASQYAGAGSPIGEKERLVAEVNKARFKKMLGEQYVDNLMVHARLGFCAAGSVVRWQKLAREQRKAHEMFGDAAAIWAFSRMENLTTEIEGLIQRSCQEIVIANYYKLIRVIEDSIGRLRHNVKELDRSLETWQRAIREANRAIDGRLWNASTAILSAVHLSVEKLRQQLTEEGYALIENGYRKSKLESALKKLLEDHANLAEKGLKKVIGAISFQLQEDLEKELQKFQRHMSIHMAGGELDVQIDLKRISDQLKTSIGAVFKDLAEVLTSIFLSSGTGPAVVVVAVVAAAKKVLEIFVWRPKKKRRLAKEALFKALVEAFEAHETKFAHTLWQQLNSVRRNLKLQFSEIEWVLSDHREYGASLSGLVADLYDIACGLSTKLARFAMGEMVSLCHIDLQLKGACVISSDLKVADPKTLRLERLVVYESLEALAKELEQKCFTPGQWRTDEDELKKRSAEAFKKVMLQIEPNRRAA